MPAVSGDEVLERCTFNLGGARLDEVGSGVAFVIATRCCKLIIRRESLREYEVGGL